ncbi:hypothetical protein H0H93_011397 [Arthromyces matolae]|nr:hypothetical protein H0H93_011397 [Arthromyces matolae]
MSERNSGVLDPEGYAICPDCGTRVNCGTAGLNTLEKRHRGSKTCKEAAQKRSKNKTKDGSILTFMQPRPVPVPSLGRSPMLVMPGRTEPEHVSMKDQQTSNAAVTYISKLRTLVTQLPLSVPEANSNDALAIFAVNPADSVNPNADNNNLWEDVVNGTLKSVLGWGDELDLTAIIKRGPLGMDGFVDYIAYFVLEVDVDLTLVEAKLSRLVEALEKM